MLIKLKAKLRAWLIETVREAIRLELPLPQGGIFPFPASDIPKGVASVPNGILRGITRETWESANKRTIKPHPIVPETSFEEMQAEALKAQEEYYVPQEK